MFLIKVYYINVEKQVVVYSLKEFLEIPQLLYSPSPEGARRFIYRRMSSAPVSYHWPALWALAILRRIRIPDSHIFRVENV